MVSEFCPLLVHGEMTGSCSFTVSFALKLHDPSPFMTPKNERRGASWNKCRIGEDVSVQQLGSLGVASQPQEAKLATIYSKRKKIAELDAHNGRRQHGK
ncbi:hypothetical protein CUMW_222180 [Citrus unshiu]|uniref:Uncharacterized protein n=1 Tax=Citrus unshiu TaxID=55188 RepID=A0A2H5QEK9_CITUN|nr:hypothetical protein CUMW_222180 [Citrus unshiu]